MEDEKKKKRNKKKKNKQNKTTTNTTEEEEDAAATATETAAVILDQNGKNDNEQVLTDAKLQNGDVDFDRDEPNGAETSMLAEAEKQQWLRREATLEETIKQLRIENDSHIQKEATLEETIEKLRNVNDSCIKKEGTFEGIIKQLKNQNDSHMQKEASLEMKIAHLESEKDIWFQEKAVLEEKLDQLVDEKAALGFKVNTTKETIAKMNVDITRLRMQVVELEENRNSLLKEKEQLTENISSLQLQLENLEMSISSANTSEELKKPGSEHGDLNSQIEAACTLVDKLITENAELVEKVNELYVKLDQQSAAAGLSSAVGSDFGNGNYKLANVAGLLSESTENVSVLGHKLGSLEVEPAAMLPYSSEPDAGEIVQVPLDDNEIRDLEQQAVEGDEKEALPLSDAPLIGAPFRFISFVAKYVSGADLVDKNALNSEP